MNGGLLGALIRWLRARSGGATTSPTPGSAGPASVEIGGRAMALELSNVVAVARREYMARARTRAFRLVTVILVIVAFGISLAPVLIRWIDQGSGPTNIEVSVGDSKPSVDVPASLAAILNAQAGAGSTTISTSAKPYAVTATDDIAGATARVDAGKSAGLLIVTRDATTGDLAFTFVTKAKAVDRISQFMRGAATLIAREDLLARSGIDPATQVKLQSPPAYASQLPSGEVQSDNAETFVNQFAIGFILSIVLFMAIIVYGQWVAYSVAEEKSSRVMEVILGAASPFELLAGKVIGVGGLALTQYAVVFIPAAIGLLFQDQVASLVLGTSAGNAGLPAGLSIQLLVVFGFVFILGFAFYAVLYAGAGALVSRTEDVNNIVAPMSLIASAGYLVAVYSTTGLIPADSPLVTVLSYVPFFSPTLILTRMGSGLATPVEVIGSLAVLAISVPIALWIAARLYAAGVLMYGQRPGLRLMLRVLRGA